jgi:hypothetical protein
MSVQARLSLIVLAVVGLAATLGADTLVLRNGSRVNGELVSVRNGIIEFEERRGFGGGRTIRVSRDEVVGIELENRGYPGDGYPGGGQYPGGGGQYPGGGRPSGMRERVISVSATQPWTDTGVNVRAGQMVYFEANGQVRWGRNRRDGPEGENNSPFNPARPIPNRPAAALIGSVGEGNDIFFIGAERGPIRVRSGGPLLLGINDEGLQDNSGSFRVTIYY